MKTSGNASPLFGLVARWLIFALTAFTMAILSLFFICETFHTGYTATTVIEIRVPTQAVTLPTGFDFFNRHPLERDVRALRSPELLLAVIKQLGLARVWGTQVFDASTSALSDTECLDYIDWRLKIQAKRGTDLIVIYISSENPQEAADLANTLAERYQKLRADQLGQTGETQEAVRIVSRASPPVARGKWDTAFKPRSMALVSALAGAGVATLMEFLISLWRRRQPQPV